MGKEENINQGTKEEGTLLEMKVTMASQSNRGLCLSDHQLCGRF